jgi:hypothetical protein
VLSALLLLGPAAQAPAQTTVYRCTSGSGEVEFRQTPCPASAAQEEVTIEDRRTGWVPPRPAPEAAPRRETRGGGEAAGAGREAAEGKRAERCWKKRRQLEEVSWQLRRGYRAGAGVKLRRRRDDYQAYIDRFCAGVR